MGHPVQRNVVVLSELLLYVSYYSAEIASTGQTSAHDPQSVQISGSIL
jgi:hypothetical protein